jgi:putative restriction endonuclease
VAVPRTGRPRLRDQISQHHGAGVLSDLETERILLAAARVGQHVFARQVLANCGSRCVFCGLRPSSFGATRMLLAGHIKPWKDSTPAERLDPRNGLAACPVHDVAFDTGMLTVNGGLRIHLARPLADAIRTDPLARQYYGRPPLREVILLPEGAHAPARRYLDWHRQKVFIP